MFSWKLLGNLVCVISALSASTSAHAYTTDQEIVLQIPRVSRQASELLEYPMGRDHSSGNVVFTITDYGMLGEWQWPYSTDPDSMQMGCEYPKGSGILHSFYGALWTGAVAGEDTIVSTGADGWYGVHEMYPDFGAEGILRLSNRPGDADFDASAIADEEFVAVYYDTLTNAAYVSADPFEGRPHIPLGLKIRQHSYSFGEQPDDDYILIRYTISNIGSKYLRGVQIGTLFDSDIWHRETLNGFTDDFAGSRWVPTLDGTDSVLVGYVADNDGDPSIEGEWDEFSARSVFSAAVIDPPRGQNRGFNWWISNDNPCYDWGPTLQTHDRPFGTGAYGTPAGDRNKYYMMSNPEIDFDQLWSMDGLVTQDWLGPPFCLIEPYISDTRFLLSFGGGDLAPGDSVQFCVAVVLGADLHTGTENWELFDPHDPEPFYNTLDFSDLDGNLAAAQTMYQRLFFGIAGDANNTADVDISDVVYLINYMFLHGAAPVHLNSGDVNGDCKINISDVVQLVRYIFESDTQLELGCVE